MSVVEEVKRAKNPQEAMLVLAAALDRIETKLGQQDDSWGEWQPYEEFQPLATHDADAGTMTFHRTDDEVRREERRVWGATFIEPAFPERPDLCDAYIEGGPSWLIAWDLDFVLGLPQYAKLQMIQDINQDNREEAEQVARELLKDWGATGPPEAWASAEAA